MSFDFLFFTNSILLGVGLAVDAFSVSVADAILEPKMKRSKMLFIACFFGAFQALMPLIGYVCVHSIVGAFTAFQKFVPWIALGLLAFIGISMIVNANEDGKVKKAASLGLGTVMVQAIATSIDALSVGFTIADYEPNMALVEAVIIGVETFALCMCALLLGVRVGKRFVNKAKIFGGIILIAIGFEIFLTSFSWESVIFW